MSKVILQGHLQVPETGREAVAAALPEHITLSRQEPGCLVFNVTADSSHPGRYAVYEEYADARAFRAHQARVKASDWWRASQHAERHYTITGLPRFTLQPHAVADYVIALALTLLGIAITYAVVTVSFDVVDYVTGVAEVILAPFYPGVFLGWPPVAALILLGIDALGFLQVPRRRYRVPAFLASNVAWVALGLSVIVLWHG